MSVMTEYESVIERLEEMRSRYKDGFSPSDRSFLESLNFRLFNKAITLTGCSDCYRDAYILISNRLKKDKKMPEPVNYILKNGALLHEFGTPEYYAHNVSDEVAERFLKKNPELIRQFQKFPDDWKKRIEKKAEKKSEKVAETPSKEVEAEAETPQAEIPQTEPEQPSLFAEPKKTQSRKRNR